MNIGEGNEASNYYLQSYWYMDWNTFARVGESMIESKLCKHGDRLTTAYCEDCALEAEIYRPNTKIDWDGPDDFKPTALEQMCADYGRFSDGGSSSYYDLPRGPNGELPKTLHVIILWWDDGRGMGWSQSNIFKASFRWHIKPDLMYNLKKILWYGNDTSNRLNDTKSAESASEKK